MDAPEISVGFTFALADSRKPTAAMFSFQAPKQAPASPRRWNRPEDA